MRWAHSSSLLCDRFIHSVQTDYKFCKQKLWNLDILTTYMLICVNNEDRNLERSQMEIKLCKQGT